MRITFILLYIMFAMLAGIVHADNDSLFGKITGITEKKVFFYAEKTPAVGETLLVRRNEKVFAKLKVTGVEGNTLSRNCGTKRRIRF